MKRGILIVGHGSKSKDVVIEFAALVEQIKSEENSSLLDYAFLELSHPDIESRVEEFYKIGVREIEIVPSSSGCRRFSRTCLGNSGNSSRKRIPR